MSDPEATLLCVANFPSGTGYAWDFIESLYAGVADRLAERGVRTLVAYPALDVEPRPLAGSAAAAVRHDFRFGRPGEAARARRFIRESGADVLYMADRPAWHPAYIGLRLAGIRRIVVHDHTSGARTRPTGPKAGLKRARTWIPGSCADRVLAVSDFVARRKIEVDLIPPDRVTRVWNSVELPEAPAGDPAIRAAVRAELELEADRPLVLCACRAAAPKGVDHLLRAFDALVASLDGRRAPALVYAGDGPALAELRALADGLPGSSAMRLLGYRDDVDRLLRAADVAVVPSVWAEAFGLAALEPMALGLPVVGTRVGGVPEVVVDGETGLLVEPGDASALASALGRLLGDPAARKRMGAAGRRRAIERFGRRRQLDELASIIGRCFG